MALSQRCSRRDFRPFFYQTLRHRAFSDQVTIGTDGLTPPFALPLFGSLDSRLFRRLSYSGILGELSGQNRRAGLVSFAWPTRVDAQSKARRWRMKFAREKIYRSA